jgi:hypothetical protein
MVDSCQQRAASKLWMEQYCIDFPTSTLTAYRIDHLPAFGGYSEKSLHQKGSCYGFQRDWTRKAQRLLKLDKLVTFCKDLADEDFRLLEYLYHQLKCEGLAPKKNSQHRSDGGETKEPELRTWDRQGHWDVYSKFKMGQEVEELERVFGNRVHHPWNTKTVGAVPNFLMYPL